MDWFKVEADIAYNPKIDELSHVEYRVLTYLWGHAMRQENGGHTPARISRLVPYATARVIESLENKGFLHRNGEGWVIHDWEEHQHDALIAQDKKRRDAQRKREAYWSQKSEEVSGE